jgi:hypothetical protein
MDNGVTFRNLLTAKQAIWVYGFAGVTKERLPKRNDVCVFPSPIENGVSFSVRKTTEKAISTHFAEIIGDSDATRWRRPD